MENPNKITPTELLKKANDIKARHDALKQEIINNVNEIEVLEKLLNQKVEELQELEKNYVEIIETLNQ